MGRRCFNPDGTDFDGPDGAPGLGVVESPDAPADCFEPARVGLYGASRWEFELAWTLAYLRDFPGPGRDKWDYARWHRFFDEERARKARRHA